jgi:DNA mismatch repair protein MutL
VWLTVPPDRLDVNVHPTKREVRFADDDQVFSLVAAACAQPLATIHPPFAVVGGPGHPLTGVAAEARRHATAEWPDRVREGGSSGGQMPLLLPVEGGEPRADVAPMSPGVRTPIVLDPAGGGGPSAPTMAPADIDIWQLHRTYILAPVRDGLVIVDQHAAHERILFEQALERLKGGQGPSQGLLFPALVDLSRSQFELLIEVSEPLRRLGWELAPLSPPTVVIQGVPAGLRVDPPGRFLQDLLDGVNEGGRSAEDERLERLASTHACHTAIRAGDLLSREAMRALVDQLFATSRPHGDPHGRPTFVRLELSELHRRFGRT